MTTQVKSAQNRLPTMFSAQIDGHVETMMVNNGTTPKWISKPCQAEINDRSLCESFLRQNYALAV
jgi:hypothetical protein